MLPRLVCRDSLAALGLSLLLVWAPLPWAGATPAAKLGFRLAAVALFLLAVPSRSVTWEWRRDLPPVALAAVAMLGLLQSLPWPGALVEVISAEHSDLYRQAAELAVPDDVPTSVHLSVAPWTSRSAALSWLGAAALLAVAMVVGRQRRFRRWLLAALVSAALFQGVIGLVRLSSSSQAGLESLLLRPEGRLRGTFANPNHLSLHLEIVMAAVAAWLWWSLHRSEGKVVRRLFASAPLGLLWLVLLGLVVLTGSRAGLAAALVGVLCQTAALLSTGRNRRTAAAVGLLLVIGVGALMGLGSRFEIRRYASVSLFEDNLRGRLEVLSPALELWRRFPLTGTGLGTFEDAFPLVGTPELSRALWNRAHNDPVELLVTGGLVGLGLGLLAAGALLLPAGRLLGRRSAVEERALGLAAVGAAASTLFHELLDFGLILPANTAALIVVLGAAASAGLNARADPSPTPRPRT